MLRKLVFVFICAFVLNLVWENVHANFYVHYRGSAITEIILLKAAFFDAVVSLIATFFFLFVPPLRRQRWLVALALVVFAVSLELFALSTGRWAYNVSMPIIPVLGVGLSPTAQLALLWLISARIIF